MVVDYRYIGNKKVFGGAGQHSKGRLVAFNWNGRKMEWSSPVPKEVEKVAKEVVKKRPEA